MSTVAAAVPLFAALPSSSWVQPTIGIVQIIVGFMQAAILWELTYHIFRRNAEQKLAEREAAWFHKIIVDPQLVALRNFFDDATAQLLKAIENSQSLKRMTGTLVQFDDNATTALGEFNTTMLPVRRNLVDVLSGFDKGVALKVGDRFATLQEDVSAWFEDFRAATDPNILEPISAILSRCHNDILSELRRYEFKTWGIASQKTFLAQLWERYGKVLDELKD